MHITYSFLHLQGATLAFDNPSSRATVAAPVALEVRQPQLKIMLSLGGWTGCETYSQVFYHRAGPPRVRRHGAGGAGRNPHQWLDLD